MARISTLTPSKEEKRNRWYLCVPGDISVNGKWRREYFQTKEKAEKRASELKKLRKEKDTYAAQASSRLIRDAVECENMAQLYGFSSMREAFYAWSKTHSQQKNALTFCELLEAYEADHQENWSHAYLSARWKPFRKKVIPIENEVVATMDSTYWREWTAKWREDVDPAPTTYNQTLGLLRGVFRHEKAKEVFPNNPLEPLPALKNVRSEVCVSAPDEVKRLMEWVWANDRELVPYFVLGFFAGLRPISEIKAFDFKQFDFEERVITAITTKTARNPRRQVPMEDNAYEWLKGFKEHKGMICPSNLVKRVNRAKEKSKIQWGHDIMRHSYGSYWEAGHRSDAGCREQLSYNMGHSNFKTYEQNYRNDRSKMDAIAYWGILPPSSK